jgi:hypothetical protein
VATGIGNNPLSMAYIINWNRTTVKNVWSFSKRYDYQILSSVIRYTSRSRECDGVKILTYSTFCLKSWVKRMICMHSKYKCAVPLKRGKLLLSSIEREQTCNFFS